MWSVSGVIWRKNSTFGTKNYTVMSRQQLVQQALETISKLPDDKVSEVIDFASYVLKKHEEAILQKGIERLVETSNAFAFLHNEEDLYSLDDLKEQYR